MELSAKGQVPKVDLDHVRDVLRQTVDHHHAVDLVDGTHSIPDQGEGHAHVGTLAAHNAFELNVLNV